MKVNQGSLHKFSGIVRLLAAALLCTAFLFVHAISAYAQDADSEESVKTSFPDVSAGHWGHPYITKLAVHGIILGDEQGNFNPDQNVRQQDAIIMAINFMGLRDAVSEYSQSGVLPFQVDDYARRYVQLAMDIGLLDAREELTADAAAEEGTIWGRRPASREWVAKITIRAIQQEDAANALSGRNTTFADNEHISSWALGYINRAVDLEIVSGFEDGTFKPQGAVTRAQMAVFLSRAEKYLRTMPERAYKGIVTHLNDGMMTVENKDAGEVYNFEIARGAIVYDATSALSRADLSDIELFYEVYVIAVNDTAYYLEILDDEIALETIEGKLAAVNFDRASDRKITIVSDGEFFTFPLSPNVSITDPEGNGMNVGSLVEDSELSLIRYAESDQPEIIQIVVISMPVHKSGQAVVIGTSDNALTIESDGQTETYPLADNVLMTYRNMILNSLDELNAGDKIEFEVKDGLFTLIRVTEPALPHLTYVEGMIDSIQQDRIYLFRSSQELSGHFIAKNVSIELAGKENATIHDLMIGDRVRMAINQNNEVTSIQVFDRQIERRIQVEIVYYDEDTSSLMLRLDRNTPALFKLGEDTVIRTDSARISLENFGNLFTNGKLVDIVHSEAQLIEFKLSSYYDGVIRSINPSNGQLILDTANFGSVEFDLENALIVSPDQDNMTLYHLQAGDKVRIALNANQNEIGLIQVNKTLIYELASKNELTRRLSVRTIDGETEDIYIAAQTPLILPDGRRGTWNDIQEDSPIMLSYIGTAIEAVHIPAVTAGKLTDVNRNNQTIRMLGYDGKNYTFTLRQEVFIVKDGRRYDDLNDVSLQPDDRMLIARDHEGNHYLHAFRAENKKFWQYNNKTNIVSFRRSSTNEDYQFVVNNQSFIHSDWVPIPLSSFKNGDEVVVYLKDGQIIEMTK